MDIREKVVVITGASDGIGAACAACFRARGARLALTGRTAAKLERVARPGDLTIVADLLDHASRQRIVDETLARFGRIDILVNNAGAGLYGPSWASNESEAREMFELNLFAPLDLIRRAIPHMQARRSGCVVNVSSVAGKATLPWLTLYSASKHALCSLTRGLRMELAPYGISAILICPGYVSTGFQRHAIGQAPRAVAESKMFRITAEQCAEAVARAVERDARSVVTPWTGWLFAAAATLFPNLVDSRLRRMLAQPSQP